MSEAAGGLPASPHVRGAVQGPSQALLPPPTQPGAAGELSSPSQAVLNGLNLFADLLQRLPVQHALPPNHQHSKDGGHAHHGAHEPPEDASLHHSRAAAAARGGQSSGSRRDQPQPPCRCVTPPRAASSPPRTHTHLLYSSLLEVAQLIFSMKPVRLHSGNVFCKARQAR